MEQLQRVTICGGEINVYGFCPYALYADLFFPEKCAETPLLELLQIQGSMLEEEALEREVMERHPEYEKEAIAEAIRIAQTSTPQETIQAMKEGRQYIIGPIEALLHLVPFEPHLLHLMGKPDLLVKRKMRKRGRFGKFCYDILEVKSHKELRVRDVLQARFYAMILGVLQGAEPRIFVETSSKTHEIKPRPWEPPIRDRVPSLWSVLEEVISIKEGRMPQEFYSRRRCRICGYHDFCYQRLKGKKDVSIVPGIGPASAGQLAKIGIFTIPELVECNLRSVYPRLRSYPYSSQRISRWKKQATAITARKAIIEGEIRLPKEISFWDIETMGLDSTLCPVIMIDVYDGLQHKQFVAKKLRDERSILKDFINHVSQQSSHLISYSGTRFDYRFLTTRCRVRKINGFAEALPAQRELDLASEIKRRCFLPIEDYSLNSVGKFFRHKWSTSISGMDVPIIYDEYRSGKRKTLRTIEAYNREETEVIAHIVRCLSHKHAIRWIK